MLAMNAFISISLFFLGVPLPLALSSLTGLLTLIPQIDPIIPAMPAILLSGGLSLSTAIYSSISLCKGWQQAALSHPWSSSAHRYYESGKSGKMPVTNLIER